ncbi:hypothetical protein Leryth_012257, partial [Lithospermum erythrorhizon]
SFSLSQHSRENSTTTANHKIDNIPYKIKPNYSNPTFSSHIQIYTFIIIHISLPKMEKEDKNHTSADITTTTEVLLQWGNKKRLRCVRVRGSKNNINTDQITSSRVRRKTLYSAKDPLFNRNGEMTSHRLENGKSTSPSPERHYTTRGSVVGLDEIERCSVDAVGGTHHVEDASNNIIYSGNSGRGFEWPKIYITLSSKEKEEDFMAMKGAWLTDMSIERYEVREKKSSKKKARGLKAMGGIESDSE